MEPRNLMVVTWVRLNSRVRLGVMNPRTRALLPILLTVGLLTACGQGALNNPYPDHQRGKNIMYSFFNERPKHLDPVQSYFENEIRFTAQIYMPITSEGSQTITVFDESGNFAATSYFTEFGFGNIADAIEDLGERIDGLDPSDSETDEE